MTHRLQILLALTLCLFGLVFIGVRLSGWAVTAPTPSAGVTISGDVSAALSAKWVRPKGHDDVERLSQSFAQSLRRILSELPPQDRLSGARLDSLIAISSERLALLLDPDFERYLAHIRKWWALDAADPAVKRP